MLIDSRKISDGSGTRNLGFGFWMCHGEMGLRQVEQGFSSFFDKFLAYLMIFQSFRSTFSMLRCSTLKNIGQKFGKKWRKALFNLPSTHFSMAIPKPKNNVSGTRSATSVNTDNKKNFNSSLLLKHIDRDDYTDS